MFETSRDILNLALTACIVIFTFFICWAIFYIVMMLKRANAAIKEVQELFTALKEKLEKFERLFNTLEEKLNHTASYLPLVFKGITELIGFVKQKREQRRRAKSS